ncbi:MFS family permease [Pseudorhizobium tarimense]|uniref:MFS family permease n=1 Tax=Pseudorhizobium tarimense TaxID=1079109 RepID=A0ABV2H603_9HYPH|nr:MFS transporter [Pseudorhizobium tarimense]
MTNLGDGVATIAWAWTASLLTREPLLIASIAIALRLPWALFAVPAGIIADRVDRRSLILWMDVLRGSAFGAAAMLLCLAAPFAAPPDAGVSSPIVFGFLALSALTVGTAEVFRDNAAQTMLPALVPHDRLESANGKLWSAELVGNALLGPPLGAALIAVALSMPFAFNAGLYGLAAATVAAITGSYRAAMRDTRDWRRELSEGFSFLQEAQLLRLLAWLTGAWNLFFQMVMIALILHVQDSLGLSPTSYGLVLATGAIGGIVGGLVADRIVRKLGPSATAQWMLLASAPAFAGIALAPGPLSLAAVLAFFEFTGLVWNAVSVSTRQRTIPNDLLGRVNSIYRLVAWGMMPVGLLLSGLIVRLADGPMPHQTALKAPFWVAAIGVLLVAIYGWRPLGRLLPRSAG